MNKAAIGSCHHDFSVLTWFWSHDGSRQVKIIGVRGEHVVGNLLGLWQGFGL
jgi:hypothetical protein